jgi:hypothetical protein
MGRENTQLCWRCQNACGNCSWSKELKPVDGWQATKIKINDSRNRNIYSYSITKCPLFIPDDKEYLTKTEQRNKYINDLGISLRSYYRLVKAGKIKRVKYDN